MARYIDADTLKNELRHLEPSGYESSVLGKITLKTIDRMPAADVVEVVRCKDCKHYKPYAKPVEDFDGECIVRECETDENEFCSYGFWLDVIKR